MAIELKINANGGNLCTIAVDRSWKVEDLKKAIEAKTQIHWLEQRLFRGKASLDDDDAIAPDGPRDVTLTRRKKSVGVWLKKVKQDSNHFETLVDYRCILPQIWADREFAEAAVKHKSSYVEYLAKELQPEFGRTPPPEPPAQSPPPKQEMPPAPKGKPAQAPPPKSKPAQAETEAKAKAPQNAKAKAVQATVPAKQPVQPPAPKPVGAAPVPTKPPMAPPVEKPQEQMLVSPEAGWQYVDPKGTVQGPFDLVQIREWFNAGFLKPTLQMRCQPSDPFVPLQELFRGLPTFGDRYLRPC